MAEYKYNAFISYRHAEPDIRVAKEIQQQLERFKIPAAIRQKYGINKIERIFKDQEELALTDDLSKQLDENLRNSEYLIVICSPSYLQSKWCLQEVDHFLRYHDRDHVICALADGEPPAVFPPVLLKQTREVIRKGKKEIIEETVEPLASDYRQDFREARRVELPRIAARLIGCSYDELVMRQEKYRRRRLAGILSAVSAGAVIAISYLLWSNAQISRNYRQSLINESKVLSGNAVIAMEEKDRYSALADSLQALPSEDVDRPVIDEAQYAAALASYAYQTPYSYLEVWRIDQAGDITDHFLSRDGRFIVCLNRNLEVSTYSISSGEKVSSFLLEGSSLPSHIEEGTNGQLISYHDGEVHCYDYIKGQQLWSLPLKYQQIGIAHLSHDRKYIAAADTLAIQVMTAEGGMYLSMPLPGEIDGYLTDFLWSEDDRYLAAVLRENGRYKIGYYEFDTSRFFLHEEEWLHIDKLFYSNTGDLIVIGDNNASSSANYRDRTYLIPGEYILTAYRDQQKLYSLSLTAATLNGSYQIEETVRGEYVVTIGNQLYLISGRGELLAEHRMPDEITGILDYDDETVSLALYGGSNIMVSLKEGASVAIRQFSGNCAQAQMMADGGYLILSDGNLQIYESVCDDSLQYFDASLRSSADAFFTSGKLLAVTADREVCLYDRESRKLLKTISLSRNDGYHYLDCDNGVLRILRISGRTGAMSVLFYDMASGELLKERNLGLREFHVARGYLSEPLSVSDASYLEYIYRGCSSMVLQDGILYLHQQDEPNTFVIYDLGKDELSSVSVNIPANCTLLDSTILQGPGAIAVNNEATRLFTVMRNRSTGAMSGIVIDLKTGEYRQVAEGTFDETMFVWKDSLLIMREHGLEALSEDGTLLYTIPLTTSQPLAVDMHDGLVICVFADGRLQTYRQGTLEKTVELALDGGESVSTMMIGFRYQKERLYLLWMDRLAAVDLSSEGTTPLFTIRQGALGCLPEGDLLVFARNVRTTDLQYYPAVYRQYSVQQLIERAEEQFSSYRKQ
ncbi:MAG: toll/interleukin-1 receptor domain-containing protein [Erysipelotrichaceae bacterium]|nr:toll/interleukin-1 receptor domain-containing protein [Erysipelotrichaceae bacterium]